jgi:hypothetical protein
MKEHKYLKEEFHRGKWQPLMAEKRGKEIHGYARITHEQAEIMNVNKDAYGVRYILCEEQENGDSLLDSVRAEYEALAGKKVYHGWTIDELNKKILELKK